MAVRSASVTAGEIFQAAGDPAVGGNGEGAETGVLTGVAGDELVKRDGVLVCSRGEVVGGEEGVTGVMPVH